MVKLWATLLVRLLSCDSGACETPVVVTAVCAGRYPVEARLTRLILAIGPALYSLQLYRFDIGARPERQHSGRWIPNDIPSAAGGHRGAHILEVLPFYP